ncbi:hypothetical protein BJI69_18655 [Luteibacter rhizovicinus DSM 16549]|uniref:Uncharacterized protein n=2 Tax=Luteibacter rhizovicinus TaxID=242606 RepID=A0A1L3EXH9_9GAMM|nr:hypothetical protein [Luteibacter rhizovicinus]APG05720.1 hypothetical protein BJI69_18655 [Luteibacter rhizovicinus DSM 16549]
MGVQPLDPQGFSTHRINRLRHDFDKHPLFQLPELARLAKELMPREQCRFVKPGMTQASAFRHDARHPDGRDIDEVFARIEETGSWIALYNVEAIPRYRALLESIIDGVRSTIEREQPGIFQRHGFHLHLGATLGDAIPHRSRKQFLAPTAWPESIERLGTFRS